MLGMESGAPTYTWPRELCLYSSAWFSICSLQPSPVWGPQWKLNSGSCCLSKAQVQHVPVQLEQVDWEWPPKCAEYLQKDQTGPVLEEAPLTCLRCHYYTPHSQQRVL